MKKLQSEMTLDELLQESPQAATTTEEDYIWLGIVPGLRLPEDFLQMDANVLRRLFITSMVPMDVWAAANQLFDENEQSAVNWLCAPAFGLGGVRPIDSIRTREGKEAVMRLMGQLLYGICP
jgi:hypothetical protein